MEIILHCLIFMKRDNTSEDEIEEKQLFSFKKEEISSEKIKMHWQKIADQMDLAANAKADNLKKKKLS